MTTEAQSPDHDRAREATTGRFLFALFVVAELLCTGSLAAWAVL